MRILAAAVALALCGCHLIYPFAAGDLTADAGPGDAVSAELSVNDGPGGIPEVGASEAGPSEAGPRKDGPKDQLSEEETSADAGVANRVVWVKTFGSAGTEGIYDVAVNAKSGAVHLVGAFSGQLAVDGCAADATNKSGQILVLTLNSGGTCSWARAFGGKGEDHGVALDVDPASGDLYIAGDYELGLDLMISGGPVHAAEGGRDGFIARLDAAGKPKASVSLGGSGLDRVTGLILDGGGHVAITGWFNGPALKLAVGQKLVMPVGAFEAGFLARYSKTLAATYVEPLAGTGHLRSVAIAADGAQEIYVAGFYSGKADIAGNALTSTGGGPRRASSPPSGPRTPSAGPPTWATSPTRIGSTAWWRSPPRSSSRRWATSAARWRATAATR